MKKNLGQAEPSVFGLNAGAIVGEKSVRVSEKTKNVRGARAKGGRERERENESQLLLALIEFLVLFW